MELKSLTPKFHIFRLVRPNKSFLRSRRKEKTNKLEFYFAGK